MKKELVFKIIKIALMVMAVALFVGVMYHLIRGIFQSLFENDVKTAQNRINSAYQFLRMILAGALLVLSMFGIYSIKVPVLPKNIAAFLGFKASE